MNKYEKDIEIIPDELDVAWIEQPTLMFRYASKVAEASKVWDNAKERLSIVRADLDKQIRDFPEKYGIEKITETVVSNTILKQSEYQQANQDVIDTQYDFNIARAAVTALENKKVALENLVKLYGQQYFAGPNLPRDINKEWEKKKMQQSADNKVGESLKRKRRD